jgi:hypothetical protein
MGACSWLLAPAAAGTGVWAAFVDWSAVLVWALAVAAAKAQASRAALVFVFFMTVSFQDWMRKRR